MVRINPDGGLDSTFGRNGFATLIAGAGGIAFQPNSQIVVGASRYNANGGLDAGFGISGRAPSLAPVSPVRLQSDGKIVALGGLTTKVLLGQLSNLIMHTGFELIRFTRTAASITASAITGPPLRTSAASLPSLQPLTW